MNCKNCNTPAPANARFCPNCGQPLTATSDSAGSTAGTFYPDRYLPQELASKLEASRTSRIMQGERRIITMLFCDVTGSTAAAEQLDPEEWTEIINGAFEHMIRPIYKYEGVVPRLMGDAILAFFGAPIAHEDDPQRAVLAGLTIQESIKPYVEEIRHNYGVSFALRVGINTGLVVVGEVGSDLRMEYTAIGDAINLAARMEQTATPGSVQISEETYKLVAPFFDLEALGGIEVKGKAKPVDAYRVLSVKDTPGQLRGLDGLSSPLVGREAELSALEESLAALQNGQGAVVTVLGEAGLGKSSLVAAVRNKLNSTRVTWLEAHALSYAQSISYFSWRQIIRGSIKAHENLIPSEVRARLQITCKRFGLSTEDISFLEALLAIESEESMQTVLGYQGEALLKHITNATRNYLVAAARETPLIIMFDDLHWIDEASLTLLSNMIDLMEEIPVLFLCIMRPDQDAPSWDFNQRIQRDFPACIRQIELSPFSKETTSALLVNLLGERDLPKSLHDQISEKAEGNPFFVEEIIRSLIETGQIVGENGEWRTGNSITDISLPNTLSGVLSARIDRLSSATKQVLHFASVIGRSFDMHTLSAMQTQAHGVDKHVQILKNAGLVQEISSGQGTDYIIHHVLIQEAAYNSILLKRRRVLHAQVGEILEETHADRLNEFAPLLAHHFYTAGDSRSLQYDLTAGESAARLYANAEAYTHFSHALKTARQIKSPHDQIEGLHTKIGQALELSGRYEEVLENYNTMEDYALEQGVPSMRLAALLAKSTLYSTYTTLHNSELSEENILKALKLSKELGDRAAQVKLHWNLMLTYLFSKRLELALEHGELALPLARELNDPETLAFVLNDLCRTYSETGEFEKSYAVIHEAREIWIKLGNQSMLADSFGAEAASRFLSGEFDVAIELASQGIQISEKIDNLWGQAYNRMLISFIYLDRGEIGRAIQLTTESVSDGDRGGLVASSTILRAELGWIYGNYGSIDKAFEITEQALTLTEEKQPGFRNLPLAILVRLHLLSGDIKRAQSIAGKDPLEPISIPYPRYTIIVGLANVELALARNDYKYALNLSEELLAEVMPVSLVDLPMVMHRKADALFGLNRIDEALHILTEACSQARELGSNHNLWPILGKLAEVYISLGRPEQAETFRKEARLIVESISGGLVGLGLAKLFLKLPRVRALMQE